MNLRLTLLHRFHLYSPGFKLTSGPNATRGSQVASEPVPLEQNDPFSDRRPPTQRPSGPGMPERTCSLCPWPECTDIARGELRFRLSGNDPIMHAQVWVWRPPFRPLRSVVSVC
jgi:hypothetical protein